MFPLSITFKELDGIGPDDVRIEILFCGVCHSDLHQARNEWSEFMPTVYPVVPGHEILGRVVEVGKNVTKFKEGDIAAVGCMVDSCRICPNCKAPAGSAITPDGVIEGLELTGNASFAVAVQWHPEDRVAVSEADRKLFEAFAAAITCAATPANSVPA